jgi:dolichol-phosphate mannosyltransferase
MDADFSHPPEAIPIMLQEFLKNPNGIVVGSRYIEGASIVGWPFKRRLLSRGAAKIARYGLKVGKITDPMSGFFILPRAIVKDILFDSRGFKILLEILVKTSGVEIKEIPYMFTDRESGVSKLDFSVILDYMKSVWRLYRYGQKYRQSNHENRPIRLVKERRKSVLFLSKGARFCTVGAGGLLVNYLTSYMLSNGILSSLWYMQASLIGILMSITSNFFLNKAWTFEDKDFSIKHTSRQYLLFFGISSTGAALQLILTYILVELSHIGYEAALIVAVSAASIGNFLLNKKLTFKEKIWG